MRIGSPPGDGGDGDGDGGGGGEGGGTLRTVNLRTTTQLSALS